MEVFSEVRASISSKIVEQSSSFHQVLEEVEARTKVDIRFTNRSYVFCGSWNQIEKVKEILEAVFCKSPGEPSDVKPEVGQGISSSTPPVSRVGSSDVMPSRSRHLPVVESSPRVSDAGASSTAARKQPTRGSPLSDVAAASTPARDQPQPAPVAPSVEETREDSGELSSPELMMDTDMWDYMAKMNAYELRQLNTTYGVELRPSTTEELTQVKIIPGKGRAVTADMMETACLTLGNLYQSLFSAVVVETCKVPPDLDDQSVCQSAKEEVTGMYHNVLVKQNEYDPRVFTFIGAERKAKEARYQFMDLIGMHPTSSRTRGGRGGHAYSRTSRHDFYTGEDDYTPLYFGGSDSRGASGFTPAVDPPRSASPVYPVEDTGVQPMAKPTQEEASRAYQQGVTQQYVASSSDSDEDDDVNPVAMAATQQPMSSDSQGEETYYRQRAPSPEPITPSQVAGASSLEERHDSGGFSASAQPGPVSLPVTPQSRKLPTVDDLIDFSPPPTGSQLSAAANVGQPQTSHPASSDFTSAKQAFSVDGLDEVSTRITGMNLEDAGDAASQRRSTGSPAALQSAGSRASSHSSLDFQGSGKESRERSAASSPRDKYDISFLDSEDTALEGDSTRPKSQSSEKSAFTKYGKSGKVMPQQNPFESKRPTPGQVARQRSGSSDVMTQSAYVPDSDETYERAPYQSLPTRSGERASAVQSSTIDLCEGCVQLMENPREMPCTHVFCQECCDIALSKDHICPKCGADWWKMEGHQPDGTLNIVIDKKESLAGYDKVGTICVTFMFPPGKQSELSPEPGRHYQAHQANTYLPNSGEGRMLLKQLKKTFDRKLLFKTKANAAGLPDTIEIIGVTLKPEPSGRGGYPDPDYLERLKAELKYRGASVDV